MKKYQVRGLIAKATFNLIETADIIGVSARTIYRLIAADKLSTNDNGRILRDSIERLAR